MKKSHKTIIIGLISILAVITAGAASIYSSGILFKGQLVEQSGNKLGGIKISIQSPSTDYQKLSYKKEVYFQAILRDSNDDQIQNMKMIWESNRDGRIGDGEEIITKLSKGKHLITCKATDSWGNYVIDEINVNMTNTPPQVIIQEPAKFSSFSYGEAIHAEALITDNEDIVIPDVAISWKSNIDGNIGRGKSLLIEDLSRGTHKVTVTTLDSGGLESNTNTTISIL